MENYSKENNFKENHSKDKLINDTNISMTDRDEDYNLELYCYNKCSNDDTEFTKNCRGIIFCEDEIIVKSFPYTMEYNHEENDKLEEVFTPEFIINSRFFVSYEGALIRVFYHKDKWFISTHRKLNAFRSKWASKRSYGEIFQTSLIFEYNKNTVLRERIGELEDDFQTDIMPKFLNSLDKNYQYMFLIGNDFDNRIVCNAQCNIFHVGTFINFKLNLDIDCGIPHTEEIKLNSLQEIIDYIKEIDINKVQGIIAFTPSLNQQYKILHREYQDLFNIRANIPSIKFRYLQLRTDEEKVNILKKMYPEFIDNFEYYEICIYHIANEIYRAYVQRFIRKDTVIVSKEKFSVIKECHSWHIADRENHKISLDKVFEVLNNQKPSKINTMIKTYNKEQHA